MQVRILPSAALKPKNTAVRQIARCSHVVRCKDNRQLLLILQVAKQIQNLRTREYIKNYGGLVSGETIRRRGERQR